MRLLSFHEAVIANDGMEVQRILTDNMSARSQFTIKMITGMLVIAVENSLRDSSQAILSYNSYAKDKITESHLNAIKLLAIKNNILPSVVGITSH